MWLGLLEVRLRLKIPDSMFSSHWPDRNGLTKRTKPGILPKVQKVGQPLVSSLDFQVPINTFPFHLQTSCPLHTGTLSKTKTFTLHSRLRQLQMWPIERINKV